MLKLNRLSIVAFVLASVMTSAAVIRPAMPAENIGGLSIWSQFDAAPQVNSYLSPTVFIENFAHNVLLNYAGKYDLPASTEQKPCLSWYGDGQSGFDFVSLSDDNTPANISYSNQSGIWVYSALPEPATIFMLALGGLALRTNCRKR